MGAFLELIINLLNTDTGNLAYNLVLSFSLAGALYFAIVAEQREYSPVARRTILGLSLLLVLRVALFLISGLAWQDAFAIDAWLPLLDRAVTLLSLVIICWLWAFDQPSPNGDAAAVLLGLLVVTGVVLGGVWWSEQDVSGAFNGSPPDVVTQIAAIGIITLGMLALLFRRPEGWVLGLVMELLLLAGHVFSLLMPLDNYSYSYIARLFQMAAYPFLLLLSQRLPRPSSAEETIPPAAEQVQDQAARLAEVPALNATQVLRALEKLTAQHPAPSGEAAKGQMIQSCRQAATMVSELMDADICLLLEPPDDEGRLRLHCAYDRASGRYLDRGQLAAGEVPMLASSLRLGRTRQFSSDRIVADFQALGRLLNRAHCGDVLYVPVLSTAGSPMLAIVLLSPEKEHSWTQDEQALLGALGRFLVYFLQRSREMAAIKIELEHTTQARRNAQDQAQRTLELNQKLRDQLAVLQEENEHKAGRVASMTALVAAGAVAQESLTRLQEENQALRDDLQRLSATAAQKEQTFEGELRLALEEIAYMRGALYESDSRIATLKASLSEAPASNEQLASIVATAQDLRQPLSSIIGYTDFILSEVIGILGEKQRKYLERIRVSTERMRRLVDDLLAATSVEGNLARLDIEDVDLRAIIQRAVVQSEERRDERQVELQIEMPDGDVRVNADQGALQKVFRRLLENAGAITPRGGEVRLLARLENTDGEQDYVLIQVTDGGGGIAAQDLPRVFTYRPADASISGLGVNGTEWADIKSLVEAHGGRIWVDSEDGHGATFSVLLPIAGAGDATHPEEAPA
jgi:signal transduction histidine kinase